MVLARSYPSADLLHTKAIDLYQAVNEFGLLDDTVYGKAEEREAIKLWMDAHPKSIGELEKSKR
jgi:hypothetical protein